MRNVILEKYGSHKGFTPGLIDRALQEVAAITGFVPGHEVDRRFILDPSRVWQVRFVGSFNRKPAVLCLDNMEHEIEPEDIRELFRPQCSFAGDVRPPHTYAAMTYDERQGYAWTIEESLDSSSPLFSPEDAPEEAAKQFALLYRALRESIREPFWMDGAGDAAQFNTQQLAGWLKKIVRVSFRDSIEKHRDLLKQLSDAMLSGLEGKTLQFMHPHLAPRDIRSIGDGVHVLYANEYWSWRQPGYDIAFPVWTQWMSLPNDRKTPEAIRDITDVWLAMVERDLLDLARPADVRTMLLNRIYGSLVIDLPARQKWHGTEQAASMPLEHSLVAEAKRLLSLP